MQIRCPGCNGALNLPQPVKAGARMACPRCGQTFQFKSPSTPRPRPAAAPPVFDDFDDFDDDVFRAPAQVPQRSRSRRSSEKKMAAGRGSRWWVPLAVVGGAFAAISLVVIATVLLFRAPPEPKQNQNEDLVAKTDQPAPLNHAAVPLKAAQKTPVVPPPVPDPNPPIELPPVQSPPKVATAGDGQLSADVLQRVKKATVMVRVTEQDGTRASGTGFFAVDKQIVVTNAHVVGMLKPGTSAPRKVEIIVDSGEPNERTFSAQVAALDRSSDLAVLKHLAEPPPALPTAMEREPLKVFSAKKLLETQVVYVFGFPFGEKLGKNITVSRSSVSSLRKDKQGILKQVQVNGGMHPGNSGGPVVDANGNVVGIAVAGIPGTTVNFAIPGDSLYRMLEGRISGISMGDSRQQGNEFLVPVTINAIDPLRRLKSVQVHWWVGSPGRPRGPADSAPRPLPDDGPHQTATLAYQSGTARGTIRVPAVPEGKTVYIQPAYQTANGNNRWVASINYHPGPLLDLKPAMLTIKSKRGQSDVYLNTRSRLKFEIFGGEELSLLSHIDTRLVENTYTVGRRATSDKQFTVGKMEWGVSIDNKAAPRSIRVRQAMSYLGELSLAVSEDVRGNFTSRRIQIGQVPQSSQPILAGLGRQMMDSLELASVPITGIRAKPGTTWTASRLVPIDTPGSYRSSAVNMTYLYKGLANHFRRRVAVIGVRGTVPSRTARGVTIAGNVRGTAYYSMSEQRIIFAEMTLDVRLMAKIGDETAKAKGEIRVKLSRMPPEQRSTNPPRT
jgi:S1-C subfamily serine protease